MMSLFFFEFAYLSSCCIDPKNTVSVPYSINLPLFLPLLTMNVKSFKVVKRVLNMHSSQRLTVFWNNKRRK